MWLHKLKNKNNCDKDLDIQMQKRVSAELSDKHRNCYYIMSRNYTISVFLPKMEKISKRDLDSQNAEKMESADLQYDLISILVANGSRLS